MRLAALGLCTLFAATACTDYTSPSSARDVYALARVGAVHLPVRIDPSLPTLLLADTFRLTANRHDNDGQILEQTTVTRDGPGGKVGRSHMQFLYRIDQDQLVFDNCPIGSFCLAAAFVYQPRVFHIVGDSLFETFPVGANLPPHVYGRVRQ